MYEILVCLNCGCQLETCAKKEVKKGNLKVNPFYFDSAGEMRGRRAHWRHGHKNILA